MHCHPSLERRRSRVLYVTFSTSVVMARRGMTKRGDARIVNSGVGGLRVVDEMLRPRESKEGKTEDLEGHLRGHCVTRGERERG